MNENYTVSATLTQELPKRKRKQHLMEIEEENSDEQMEIDSEESDVDERKRAFTMSTVQSNQETPALSTLKLPKLSQERTSDKLSSKEEKNLQINRENLVDELLFESTLKKINHFKMTNFLEKHQIDERMRAKMMDWMIEVLKIYQQREETIFRSFYLLDYFLWNCPESIPIKKLHLLGTVCLMIASKTEEVSFINVNSVLKNIAYNKFTKEELLDTELVILKMIDFRTNFPTIYELTKCAFRFIKFTDKRTEMVFQNSALLISKTCLFSYEIMNHFTFDEIAALSIIMVLKIIEKINPNQKIDKFAKLIVKKFKLDKNTLVQKLQFITEFTLEFDKTFPFVSNLKKFYSFSF